jgi:hypothetical protein
VFIGDFSALTSRQRIFYVVQLAENAVAIEPVSSPNSLPTGKLTGNFAKFGLARRFLRPDSQRIQCVAEKFPTQPEQGIFAEEQGIFAEEQGISSTQAAIAGPMPMKWPVTLEPTEFSGRIAGKIRYT